MEKVTCKLCNLKQFKNGFLSKLMRKLHILHKLHKRLNVIAYTHMNPIINYIFSLYIIIYRDLIYYPVQNMQFVQFGIKCIDYQRFNFALKLLILQ